MEPRPLSGSHRTQTTYLFMGLSCGFMLTHKTRCQACDEEDVAGITSSSLSVYDSHPAGHWCCSVL